VVEDLIIIGAGGTSRDIAEAVEDINADGRRWRLLGFLDDDPGKAATTVHDYPVLGTVGDAERYATARFIIGIANYRERLVRRSVAGRVPSLAGRFATVVHPSARVSRRTKIGEGSTILTLVTVSPDVVIGSHVIVSHAVTIDHEAILDDYVTVAAHATITGLARIAEGAYVGAGSTILSSCTVGEGALVGIGAVVIDDVAAHTTVLGNPASVWGRQRRGGATPLRAGDAGAPSSETWPSKA
jgi:sugar O-acyltransferase (sialic acid O-acetyltransferase NeuD family)